MLALEILITYFSSNKYLNLRLGDMKKYCIR